MKFESSTSIAYVVGVLFKNGNELELQEYMDSDNIRSTDER